jgi:alkanesulfonate monooxygenase SsuD/methylene tetrahydromethanopterin reductase-like flavin-dependent oxidoreductase (luciferase family)
MRRIGAVFSPYPHPPEAIRDAVVAAEESGVQEVWMWEDCFRESAYAVAGAALAWTSSLRIGIGISPMPLRNVAATAMEIATLERMFPGRLLPGVGHGVQSWMRQVGAKPASPLTLLAEYVPALRSLLAGEQVSAAGRYVTLRDVALDWPPAVTPSVLAAAEGPKTLHLAGEVADGAILNSRFTAQEVAAFVAAVRAGREASGRAGSPHIIAYVVAAFGADALARASAAIDDPADAADRVLAGSVDDVAAQAEAFFAAGVDDIVLLPPDDVVLTEFFASAGEVTRVVSNGR